MVNCAVFLDRDGVINKSIIIEGKPYAPRTIADFVLLPDAELAIEEITRRGYLVFVVTNQPDIGNGLVDPLEVGKMHQVLKKLPIQKIYMCPHSQTDGCSCRKPLPGMMLCARDEYDIDLQNSFLIGDRKSDMDAAKNANCKSIFIDYGYDESKNVSADFTCGSISESLRYLSNI